MFVESCVDGIVREFPSAPCLSGKKIDESLRLEVVEIARVA